MPHSTADHERKGIDWKYWQKMLNVKLPDLVLLSLGIDPRNPQPKLEGDLGSQSELQNDPEATRSGISNYPGGLPGSIGITTRSLDTYIPQTPWKARISGAA